MTGAGEQYNTDVWMSIFRITLKALSVSRTYPSTVRVLISSIIATGYSVNKKHFLLILLKTTTKKQRSSYSDGLCDADRSVPTLLKEDLLLAGNT